MSARDDRNKREAERTHQILTEARAQEHGALVAALVAEYAAILRQEGPWEERSSALSLAPLRLGGCEALRHVAERLGVSDLHAQAAEVVAHESGAEEEASHGDV